MKRFFKNIQLIVVDKLKKGKNRKKKTTCKKRKHLIRAQQNTQEVHNSYVHVCAYCIDT